MVKVMTMVMGVMMTQAPRVLPREDNWHVC